MDRIMLKITSLSMMSECLNLISAIERAILPVHSFDEIQKLSCPSLLKIEWLVGSAQSRVRTQRHSSNSFGPARSALAMTCSSGAGS
jgi:hypothetical protein